MKEFPDGFYVCETGRSKTKRLHRLGYCWMVLGVDYFVHSFHFISFHFISFHFISFHFISFHFISFHFISFISFHFISFHFISFHFISFHFISFHFISFHSFIHSFTYLLRSRAKEATCTRVPCACATRVFALWCCVLSVSVLWCMWSFFSRVELKRV